MKLDEKTQRLVQETEKKIGHKISYTRRDFLSHGLTAFSASLALPSLPALFADTVFAGDCGGQAGGNYMPFMCFDMAGGAALAGNALVGKVGGPENYLSSYSTLGWNPKESGALDSRFGLPFSAKYSGLLRGMVQTISPEAQANLRLASVCHFAQLDSPDNRQNIAALVQMLGGRGQVFTDGLSSLQTISGGFSKSARTTPFQTPVYVNSFSEIQSSLYYGGMALGSLGIENLKILAEGAKYLTAAQMEQLKSGQGGALLQERVNCYLNDSMSDIGDRIDPRKNEFARTIYNITQTTAPTSPLVVESTVCMNAINGLAGPSVWTLGGCDYHDGTATTGDGKDLAMGQTIGRAVQLAHKLQKPFFFQLISDGSCSADSGTRNWRGDTNEGMQIFGYYRPNGAPQYIGKSVQIGGFTDAQGADRNTIVGADPARASLATFANYCQVQGKLDRFKELFRVFSDAELESLLVFAPG